MSSLNSEGIPRTRSIAISAPFFDMSTIEQSIFPPAEVMIVACIPQECRGTRRRSGPYLVNSRLHSGSRPVSSAWPSPSFWWLVTLVSRYTGRQTFKTKDALEAEANPVPWSAAQGLVGTGLHEPATFSHLAAPDHSRSKPMNKRDQDKAEGRLDHAVEQTFPRERSVNLRGCGVRFYRLGLSMGPRCAAYFSTTCRNAWRPVGSRGVFLTFPVSDGPSEAPRPGSRLQPA